MNAREVNGAMVVRNTHVSNINSQPFRFFLKVFRVSFNVSQFDPDEINVKTQDNRLMVQAKHEEKGVCVDGVRSIRWRFGISISNS